MGAECCACAKGVDSPTRGSTCLIVLIGHRSCRGHDGGAVLVESLVSGAPAQEGLALVFPMGVLSVCIGSCLLFVQLLPLLFLSLNSKGNVWVAGVIPQQF
jgi:hypothetical protein